MQCKSCCVGLISAGCGALILAIVGAGSPPSSTVKPVFKNSSPTLKVAELTLAQRVNETMKVAASEIIRLDLLAAPDEPITTNLTITGQQYTLDLAPHSIRADGYELRAQQADGSWLVLDPGPERTLRGSLREVPGSIAAGSLLDEGLHAMILMPDDEKWWVQPIAPHVEGADANQYVLYRSADVIAQPGVCGNNDAVLDNGAAAADGGGAGIGPVCSNGLFCALVACDADVEYYNTWGPSVSNVQSRISMVINTMNIQYERDVCIRHLISAILVRTSEPDPYSSNDPGTLLGQFQGHWVSQQGSIPRHVAQLFTGRDMDGNVIGIAYWTVGGWICTGSAYNLVQSDCCSPNFSCATDLSAHELGHNWGSHHCGCVLSTMNAFITCSNNFNLAPDTQGQIIAGRDDSPCLFDCASLATTLPFVDQFPTGVVDYNKWSHIDGETSTLAMNPPSSPYTLNLDGSSVGGDVIETRKININGGYDFKLEYSYQQTGGADGPEANEDLVVEYFNSAGQWTELNRHLGSGPNMTTFQQVMLPFPSDAMHGEFRLRFRAISTQINADDWFIDNVQITIQPPPVNNVCGSNLLIGEGSTPFTTLGATTDGLDEPGSCDFNSYSHLENDVWFRYFAGCTDTATISLCDADFDAKLAVYNNVCPGGSQQLLACSDNDCGDDPVVSFPATQGTIYRIRIGGFEGATGSGTVVITCGAPCVGDITDGANPGTPDGQVNVSDLLLVIGSWGGCPKGGPCYADIAPDGGDGAVNVTDLLLIIAAWGACP